MAGYVLKVKTKSGQHILKNLKPESTLGELKKMLSELTKIPISNLNILSGFPPKVVDLSKNGDLKSCGIHSGDTLIIEEKNEPLSSTVNNKTSVPKFENNESYSNVQEDINSCPGILMKHVVPADNSCLFTSIHYVLNGKDDTGGVAQWMRQLIAETVSKNQDVYSEAVLGKPNSDYCKWIKDDKSWGGAIEISILANYYGIEIAVVDTINAIINRFGEDQDYPLRVFLLFDGIHYDPLYLEPLEVCIEIVNLS